MGALSPRTRNAQVEMFQSGEVDYLVATDAIGMGLNMDVNHVWFASLRKYDGRQLRPLRDVEIAQIAGRAGRYMNDGTFGTTIDVGGLDEETVEAIENHRFDPLRDLQWRNSELDFRSVPALLASLNAPPPHAVLQRVREQDDQFALQTLSQHSEFLPRLHAPGRVKLLWDVCQVPDFRKTMTEEHTALLGQLFQHLTQGGERLPDDWIDSHVKRLERFDGDIDTLMTRIAHVRTWTYISHRADWIQRAQHWQERARAIEDRLSDVLHQRLTQRFVDRRAALLVRRLRDEGEMTTSVAEAGEVIVEGEHLGRVEGFRFVPDATEGQTDQKAVLSAALRALRENLPARLQAFTGAPDGELVFDSQLRICWGGGPVARLMASGDVLAPKVEALASDLLDGPAREEVRKRAATWVETRIRLGLSELMDARASSEQLPPGARGIVFQLCEHLGILPRRPIEQQMAELSEDDRKALAKLGVRVGIFSLYFPSMLKPVPIRLRAGLWMVAHNRDSIPPLPAEGRTSMDLPPGSEREFYGAIGYIPLGNHAIRADMVERLAAMARQAVRESRENARRAQQDRQQEKQERKAERKPRPESAPSTPVAPPASSTPLSADEISEWAIVAAAFGELEAEAAPVPEAPADVTAEEATPETAPAEPVAYATEESAPEPAPAEEASSEAPEVTNETATAEASAAEEPTAEADAPAEEAKAEAEVPVAEAAVEPATTTAEEPVPEEPKPEGPRPLPPGWFRATPQMMSLVGCSEPEMADVLRGLGYRVHPPSDEHGPLHAFSVKPRFVREREEQRERQRQQERERRDQRRRERPERPNERQFFSDAPRRDRPPGSGTRPHGDRPQGERQGDRPKGDRPPRDDRRGPRPPRRDADGPALRLYATTEKKGDVSDSPFAKLLELKLGGKK
jgi:ATP-dependent RNA helicase SUPV3L1/SUV3